MPATWGEAFAVIAERVAASKPESMAAIVGDLAAAEEIKALKDLMTALGVANLDCRQDGAKLGGARQSYLFNTTIAGVEAADAILLIGCNPRWEAPVLNARIRKTWLGGALKVANIGAAVDLTYPVEHLGAGVDVLEAIANGSHAFAKVLKDAKRPMLILGSGAVARADGAAMLKLAAKIASDTGMIGPAGSAAEGGWNGFNVLHTAASRVGALDLGFVQGPRCGRHRRRRAEGRDRLHLSARRRRVRCRPSRPRLHRLSGQPWRCRRAQRRRRPAGRGLHREGRPLRQFRGPRAARRRAAFPPGEAKEDWAILRALSDVLGKTLPYDNLDELRKAIVADAPHFAEHRQGAGASGRRCRDVERGRRRRAARCDRTVRPRRSRDFYLTNPIARASETMAECSREFVTGANPDGGGVGR